MNTRNIIAGALAFGITSLALGQVIGKPEDQIRFAAASDYRFLLLHLNLNELLTRYT